MGHKYKVNQPVRILRRTFSDARAAGGINYEITRLMPADLSGEYSYRIKALGSVERAVLESDIVGDSERVWVNVGR